MEGLDGREHGENLLFYRQVTLVWKEGARVTSTLALCCQFLEQNTGRGNGGEKREKKEKSESLISFEEIKSHLGHFAKG